MNHQERAILIATAYDQRNYDLVKQHSNDILTNHSDERSVEYRNLLVTAYYLSGKIAELEKQFERALELYATTYALHPSIESPFKDFQRLAIQTDCISNYIHENDIVVATGGLFVPGGFNGNSIHNKALGGSESAIVYMTKEWVKLGKKVSVYCPCDKPGEYDGVHYHSNKNFFVSMRLKSPRAIVASRFDMYLQPPIESEKKILWVHDIPDLETYSHLDKSEPQFDTLAVLSNYQSTCWKNKFNLGKVKIFSTTNGFDNEIFPRSLSNNRAPQLIYISRPSRGLAQALKIFERLRMKHPELALAVCLYTPHNKSILDDPEVSALANELKAPGIIFLGELTKKDLANELRRSTALLYPNVTEAETSCIAAIEAMAAGCPVISSNRGALPETAPNNIGGIIVEYDEDEEILINRLSEATESLLSNPEQMERIRISAMNYVNEIYPWSKVANQWINYIG